MLSNSSVQYLIEKEGIDVNKISENDCKDETIDKKAIFQLFNTFYENTPLHCGCYKGHLQIVQSFILLKW